MGNQLWQVAVDVYAAMDCVYFEVYDEALAFVDEQRESGRHAEIRAPGNHVPDGDIQLASG